MKENIIYRSFQAIRKYLTPRQKQKALVIFLLMIVTSVLDLVGLAAIVPIMMASANPQDILQYEVLAWLYRLLSFQSERNFLVFLIVGILVFFIFKNIVSVWFTYFQANFSAEIGTRIIRRQVEKFSNFPFLYFNEVGSGKLMHNAIRVPEVFVNSIVRAQFIFFSEAIIMLLIVLGILVFQPLLMAILAVVLVPGTIIMYRVLRSRSQAHGAYSNALKPKVITMLNNLFNGFVELRLNNRQDFYKERLLKTQARINTHDARVWVYSLLPTKLIELIAVSGIVIVFFYATFISQSVDLIALVGLFAAAAYRLMPSMNRLLTSMVLLKGHQFTIDELDRYSEEHYRERISPDQQPVQFREEILIRDLTFSFPGKPGPALHNITLRIRKGEKIGLIGSSGSGKTTLVNLLLRLYTEQQGQILVDGIPLNQQNVKAWQHLIGYVKQDTFLMESSIRDNITLGDEHVDETRFLNAMELASLTDVINRLPEGADTLIGERGFKLSGGQRQRIGIARALYKQTQVLIFDEATSALDNETEREVTEAIDRLSGTEITILIIAHRITTLRNCDRIYEMGNGQIIGEYQYEDLVARYV